MTNLANVQCVKGVTGASLELLFGDREYFFGENSAFNGFAARNVLARTVAFNGFAAKESFSPRTAAFNGFAKESLRREQSLSTASPIDVRRRLCLAVNAFEY